ncbi:F-box/RNI-like superfamily protein [Rhynchospora pubera]|uniref:F-box/RNI-like superfamily protein n=1 Tax=Rhynchospora pubera TaxID=906938 RepID=A0AAV8EGM5_9POAL|nr:F-box/RNI-like superfamily protein [Rhynchospora pubera]
MITCIPLVRQNASSRKVVTYTRPDRLSDLPNVLLIKILSSLKAREVAQTCILSKRWRNLWASVPCLNFDIAEFSSLNSTESHRRFIKFVSSFLLSIVENASLDVFHLICDGDHPFYNGISDAASAWIEKAVKCKPKKLQLEVFYYEGLTIPDSLYICDSLEELYIRMDSGREKYLFEPEEVYLPKLKRLHLSDFQAFAYGMEKLRYGCPILESLSLVYFLLETQNVFFGSLKRLSMTRCYFDYLDFSISAPDLEYLSIDGGSIGCISSNKMPKVTEASIIFYRVEETEYDVLSSLVNVEVLEITIPYLSELVKYALKNSLIFPKLKRLTLGRFCMNCAFSTLSSLLKRTSKLEILTLYHDCSNEVDGDCCCMVNKSKILQIVDCYRRKCKTKNSIEKVEWFDCKCLKEVKILCNKYTSGVLQLVKRVKLSTKGLKKVRVVVLYYGRK